MPIFLCPNMCPFAISPSAFTSCTSDVLLGAKSTRKKSYDVYFRIIGFGENKLFHSTIRREYYVIFYEPTINDFWLFIDF